MYVFRLTVIVKWSDINYQATYMYVLPEGLGLGYEIPLLSVLVHVFRACSLKYY